MVKETWKERRNTKTEEREEQPMVEAEMSFQEQVTVPIPLYLVNITSATTFQLSSLPLLFIVNTHAKIPPKYIPAYTAMTFLPYSLRPMTGYLSNYLLTTWNDGCVRDHHPKEDDTIPVVTANRHDRLLPFAFLLGGIAFTGTTCIPKDGIVETFAWGFIRGMASSWIDFLLGMLIIEASERLSEQSTGKEEGGEEEDVAVPGADAGDDNDNEVLAEEGAGVARVSSYEAINAMLNAQCRTAHNVGTVLASTVSFSVFSVHNNQLNRTVVLLLLSMTVVVHLLGMIVAIQYQKTVTSQCKRTNQNKTRINITGDTSSQPNRKVDTAGVHDDETDPLLSISCNSDPLAPLTTPDYHTSTTVRELDDSHNSRHFQDNDGDDDANRTMLQSMAIIVFQMLLALSSLQHPVTLWVGRTTWFGLEVSLVGMLLLIALVRTGPETTAAVGEDEEISASLGNHHLCNTMKCSQSTAKFHHPSRPAIRMVSQFRLSWFFFIRYTLPTADIVYFSYLYTVWESQPLFLQTLTILQSCFATLSSYLYAKFLATYNTGWSLITIMFVLDIITGSIALFDIVVITVVNARTQKNPTKEIWNVSIDRTLQCIVLLVESCQIFHCRNRLHACEDIGK